MPTYDWLDGFMRDYHVLTKSDQALFRIGVRTLTSDLRVPWFRKGLRVKALQGHDGIFEVSWAPDGRARFEYGPEVRPGEPHIIWRRVGGHDIFAISSHPLTSIGQSLTFTSGYVIIAVYG